MVNLAMPVSHAVASLALLGPAIVGAQFLAPSQDINLPSSGSATNPLEWLGANGPYFAGMQHDGLEDFLLLCC